MQSVNWKEIDEALETSAMGKKISSKDADLIADALSAAYSLDRQEASNRWSSLLSQRDGKELRLLLSSMYRRLVERMGVESAVDFLVMDFSRVEPSMKYVYPGTNISYRCYEMVTHFITMEDYLKAIEVVACLKEVSADYHMDILKVLYYLERYRFDNGLPILETRGISHNTLATFYEAIIESHPPLVEKPLVDDLLSRVVWLTKQPFGSKSTAEGIIPNLKGSTHLSEILYYNRLFFSAPELLRLINAYLTINPSDNHCMFYYSYNKKADDWLLDMVARDTTTSIRMIQNGFSSFWGRLEKEYLSKKETTALVPFLAEKIKTDSDKGDKRLIQAISSSLEDMYRFLEPQPPLTFTVPIDTTVDGIRIQTTIQIQSSMPRIILRDGYMRYVNDENDVRQFVDMIAEAVRLSEKNDFTEELLPQIKKVKDILQ